jgi:1,4-dihydroxy-2-naphthoyl-CoA hydrolase
MSAPIWFKALPTELFTTMHTGLVGHIGIELTEAGPDFLKGRMPVDERTRQPFGLLHGGASIVLAETLASVASSASVDLRVKRCVGLEINANHLRGVKSGWVTGIARPIHLGRATHVWDIQITDEGDRLVCISRCTVAVVDAPVGEAGSATQGERS